VRNQEYGIWRENVERFLQFSDLGPKSVHPGVNLAGDYQGLVSDYIIWRKYRQAMVLLGRIFTDDMARGHGGRVGEEGKEEKCQLMMEIKDWKKRVGV
jgi:hypothetical protein